MTLSDLFDRLEGPHRTVTGYAPDPPTDVLDWLETGAAIDDVDYRSLPDAATADRGFLVVREDGEFVAALGLEVAREFLEPPIHDPWADALEDATYRHVIEVFDATVWHTLDRRQLLAVSREIENRAWRAGDGTLRVGFQRAGALEPMVPVYTRLARETALEIHVYIDDDWTRPSIPDVTVHSCVADEIGEFWFLSFDGTGEELQASGLLARERDPGAFEGIWTDDVRLVEALEREVESVAD